MEYISPQIYFLLAKYTFILSSLICAYMRRAHMCMPYNEHEEYFYPARKSVILTFLLMTLEFPYLLDVNSANALLYVQIFGLVVFAPISILLFQRYFFFYFSSIKTLLSLFLPSFILLSILFIAALNDKDSLADYKLFILSIGGIISFIQILFLIRITRRVFLKIRHTAEMLYSDESDFPFYFAKRWVFVPCGICLLMLLVAGIGTQQIMMFRDIILSLLFVYLSVSILSPHRKNFPDTESENLKLELGPDITSQQLKDCKHIIIKENSLSESKRTSHRLSIEQREQLEQEIVELIVSKELYKKNKLKLEDLLPFLNTNSSYVSEAITCGTYGSFYKMINHFRISYCLKMMKEKPDIKLEELATNAGFSSRTTFWRAFKAATGKNPSKWTNSK